MNVSFGGVVHFVANSFCDVLQAGLGAESLMIIGNKYDLAEDERDVDTFIGQEVGLLYSQELTSEIWDRPHITSLLE